MYLDGIQQTQTELFFWEILILYLCSFEEDDNGTQ